MLVKVFILAYNNPMRLEQKVAQRLIANRKTLAIAESCTGGLVVNRLTNISGSSQFLKLGIIAYSNAAKIKLLGVPKAVIRRYGAVSEQTALAMAKAVQRILKTDFGVGITGIAGPTGATRAKPVGMTYIAIHTGLETLCLQYLFEGNRAGIKSRAATQALRLLDEFLD